MAEATDPGVTAPPAEPAAPAAPAPSEPAQPTEPTGGEAVTSTGKEGEQTVPFSRFQEVNDKAKQAEEDAQKANEELEALRQQQQSSTPNSDEDPDPDIEKVLDSYAKRKGLVSKEELATEQTKIQVQQDVKDLTATPPNPGIDYDHKAVMKYAQDNNMPVTSKAALRAAYRELNYDKIVEAQRQSAIEGYKKANSSGAEQPGSTGATAPEEPELTGKIAKERTRERIRLARQKLV